MVLFTVADCGFCALLSVETPIREVATQVKKIMRTKVQQNLPVLHETGDGDFTGGSFCNLNSNYGRCSEARSFTDSRNASLRCWYSWRRTLYTRSHPCCSFGYSPRRSDRGDALKPRESQLVVAYVVASEEDLWCSDYRSSDLHGQHFTPEIPAEFQMTNNWAG